MYTTTIGRTFLKAYNDKYKKNYAPKSFFESIFIPMFFDHQKYMMTAGNSPLENPKLSWDKMIKGNKPFETPDQRKERITKTIKKIETEPADASTAIGYPVLSPEAPTTSQVTEITMPDSKNDIYLSWIGAALGIGVKGGINILFDNPVLLLDIFEGWQHYRDYLNKTKDLKGNQINTWNGNWIAHKYSPYFDEDDPVADMNPLETASSGLLNLTTTNWVKVLMGIAQKYNIDNFIGYLYNIGQTNTTIGFIPFKLKEINRPNVFYRKIFGESTFKKDFRKIENLLGTAFGLRFACQYGAIGVQSMEPKGLKAYLPTQKSPKKISVKQQDEDQSITFNTYLIWILAMMNNEQLWDHSREIAQELLNYEAGAGKGRMNRANNVTQLLESSNPKQFLSNMIPIVEDAEEVENLENLGKVVHNMPKDNFPYFNTLIRFQYTLLNK